MRDLLLTLAAFGLALWGFSLLALSQARHFETVHACPPPTGTRTASRMAGFTAIGLCLPLCIVSEGAGFGSLLWLLLISAAAMAIALTLTWRPRWLRALTFTSGR